MYLEILFLLLLVGFPIAILVKLGRSGYWGELTKAHGGKIRRDDADKLSWAPIFVKQKRARILFLSITKIGVVGNQILIDYILPFGWFLSQIRINREEIESYTKEYKLGIRFLRLQLKQPISGSIFIPMKMKAALDGLLNKQT